MQDNRTAYYQRSIDAETLKMFEALAIGNDWHAYIHAKVAAHNARGILEGQCSCGEQEYDEN